MKRKKINFQHWVLIHGNGVNCISQRTIEKQLSEEEKQDAKITGINVNIPLPTRNLN